jgi:hypothetical protein
LIYNYTDGKTFRAAAAAAAQPGLFHELEETSTYPHKSYRRAAPNNPLRAHFIF